METDSQDTELTGERRRFALPTRLNPVPSRWRRPLGLLWLAWLGFVLTAQAGGLWREWVHVAEIDPRFAAVGLVTAYTDTGFTVDPATETARAAGVPEGGTVLAVNGQSLPPDISEEALSLLLEGSEPTVMVRIRSPGGAVTDARLVRGANAQDEASSGIAPTASFAMITVFNLIGVAVLLLAAALLVRRRPGDPVALMLSFSFLSAVGFIGSTYRFYDWVGASILVGVVPAIWMGLLVAVLPAFPDSRFVPRRGAWLTVLALPFTLIIMLDAVTDDETVIALTTLIGFGVGLAAAAMPLVRYRRTPPGLERQQLKWAAFGFAGSLSMLTIAVVLMTILDSGLPEAWRPWAMLGAFGLLHASFILLPVGLLISTLRLRLWDADAAIGRTAGYAAVTLLLAGVWAGTAKLVNDFIAAQMGGAGGAMTAAVSTIVAALVFGPARERVGGWVERRFQAGILQIRKLPARLQLWQQGDRPEDVGARVAEAVTDHLHAAHAAVLIHDGEGYRVTAATGVDEAAASAWIAARDTIAPLDKQDAVFPVRMMLDDAGTPIGALLIGPRTDGSSYPRDERAALKAIEGPLAAALRLARRRSLRESATDGALAALEERLARLEDGRRPG